MEKVKIKTRVVLCSACGRPFETGARRACYCSPECKAYGAKLARGSWQEKQKRAIV